MSIKSLVKATVLAFVPMVHVMAQGVPEAAPSSTFNWALDRPEAPMVKLPGADQVASPAAPKKLEGLFPRKIDLYFEVIEDALLIADWGQTLEASKKWHSGPDGWCEEMNPILGPHPTRAAINNYFGALVLSRIALLKWASADTRLAWNTLNIVLEAVCVGRNASFGIRVHF